MDKALLENARAIPLTQGFVAIVDAADYEALAAFVWTASRNRSTIYAGRKARDDDGVRRTIKMHRVIMGPPPGLVVDHINGDGLDNRRANLRICTHSENQRNRRSANGSSSQYLGVSWIAQRSKWQARIRYGGKQHHLGLYPSEIDAAKAYDAAAQKHFGQFANPNFHRSPSHVRREAKQV